MSAVNSEAPSLAQISQVLEKITRATSKCITVSSWEWPKATLVKCGLLGLSPTARCLEGKDQPYFAQMDFWEQIHLTILRHSKFSFHPEEDRMRHNEEVKGRIWVKDNCLIIPGTGVHLHLSYVVPTRALVLHIFTVLPPNPQERKPIF